MPVSVKQILSYIPALAETELPSEVEREKASHLDRYLDSICACIDLLGHPPFFVRWRKEAEVSDVFFSILAEDLLLGEATLKKKNEAADSWKWGALERLSYKLVDLYLKKHNGLSIPPRPESSHPSPAPIEEVSQASTQKEVISHLESSSPSPSSSKEPLPLPMLREIPREISDNPKEKENNLAAEALASHENKEKDLGDIVRAPVAKDKAEAPVPIPNPESDLASIRTDVPKNHSSNPSTESLKDPPAEVLIGEKPCSASRAELCDLQPLPSSHIPDVSSTNSPIASSAISSSSSPTDQPVKALVEKVVPALIVNSEEEPEIPSSAISPFSDDVDGRMSEETSSVASSQVNGSRASPPLIDNDPILGDSFDDDLMSRIESRSPVDLASVTPTWKRFNRRSIHTKSRLFSHVVNLRKNTTDDVAQTFFSERDRLASLWAVKESLLKRSTVWQRPLTRDRHLLQVKEVFKKLSPFEKCELLRRGIYLIHGKRGDDVVDFLKKLFLESFLELDESEKEQIRSYVSEDERLGSLLGFTIES